MYKFFYEKDFIDSFIKKTPLVKSGLNLPEITWDMAFQLFNEDYILGNKMGTKKRPDYGFKIRHADRIEPIDDMIKELYNLFNTSPQFNKEECPLHPSDAHQIYMSLTTESGSYGEPHIDPENVIFWQNQGVVNWKIWSEDSSEIEFDVLLNPGDLIYCPPYRKHHVVSITPRFGTSLGFGDLKKIGP